jgi:hypothetical protein
MADLNEKLRFATPDTRAALVVAHPGHELVVHGWLEVARPRVFIFTDGSGRSAQSRLDSTTRILNQTGAKPGSIYGRLTDPAGYSAILNHEFDLFIGLADELTEALVGERIDYVAGDAIEGYNPMHDVCRLVINAAVTVACRSRGHRVANFEFSLIGQPKACPDTLHAGEVWLQLDEDAFARKMAAAKGYTEVAGEVFAALGRTSVDAFRVEYLHLVDNSGGQRPCDEEPIFYEHYGEKQVAAGHYQRVLRYDEHIAPLAEALRRYAEAASNSIA